MSESNYTYTIGIDTVDSYLWYNHTNNSLQLTNIQWKGKDTTGVLTNPLNVYLLTYFLQNIGHVPMECIDIESDTILIAVGILVQGLL